MICSVEAEFPNGVSVLISLLSFDMQPPSLDIISLKPPMVARQIKSGMRSGTTEKLFLLGETICRYADAVP